MKNYSKNPFEDQGVPSRLPSIYAECIQDKNFSQMKAEQFAEILRKNIDSFVIKRTSVLNELEGKRTTLKIMQDMN